MLNKSIQCLGFLLLSGFLTAQAGTRVIPQVSVFQSYEEQMIWFDKMEIQLAQDDPRRVFLEIYKTVSLEMPNLFKENQFKHPEWVRILMLRYVSLYRNALECELSQNCPVPKAWRTAFSEGHLGKISALGQLLVSISAHVNRDLPITLASISETRFTDPTYVADFRKIILIFDRKMPKMFEIIQKYQACRLSQTDKIIVKNLIEFVIKTTRDKAWNWAIKLVKAQNDSEEQQVFKGIEAHTDRENLSIYLFSPGPQFLICF